MKREYFSKLNLDGLLFDATIMLGILVFRNFVLDGKAFWQIISESWYIVPYGLMFFFLPWYFGHMHFQFKHVYGERAAKISLYVFIVLMTAIFSFLTYLFVRNADAENFDALPLLITTACLILGPLSGIMTEQTEQKELPYTESSPMVIGIALLFTFILMFAGGWYLYPNHDAPFLAFMGIFVGSLIIGAIFLGVLDYIYSFFAKQKDKKIFRAAANIALPIFIAIIFLILSDLTTHLFYSVNSSVGSCGTACRSIIAILGGFIPFRILLMMMPPVTIPNIALGFTTIALMIFG